MKLKNIAQYFHRLEVRMRGKLSHYPILYAVVGGVGIILFWRGVWHFADDLSLGSIVSMIVGAVVLLLTGVFVSAFIGSKLIISGLIGEKKLTEKTEGEIETEEDELKNLKETLNRVEKKLSHLDEDVHKK